MHSVRKPSLIYLHVMNDLFGYLKQLQVLMAVVLVGAMLVGHIETVWPMHHSRKTISTEQYSTDIYLDTRRRTGSF